MKYLIQDTERHSLGEIYSYFKHELRQTNLNSEDIVVEKSLKFKIGMVAISEILDEIGFTAHNIDGVRSIILKDGQIRIAKKEILERFEKVYQYFLTILKKETMRINVFIPKSKGVSTRLKFLADHPDRFTKHSFPSNDQNQIPPTLRGWVKIEGKSYGVAHTEVDYTNKEVNIIVYVD